MTFSLNNYPSGDPRLAQAKLWEWGFLEEMRAFQRRTAGMFQVTFMAEVGAVGPRLQGMTQVSSGGFLCPRPGLPTPE